MPKPRYPTESPEIQALDALLSKQTAIVEYFINEAPYTNDPELVLKIAELELEFLKRMLRWLDRKPGT